MTKEKKTNKIILTPEISLPNLFTLKKQFEEFTKKNSLPSTFQITGGCLAWCLPTSQDDQEFAYFQIPGPDNPDGDPCLFHPRMMTVARAQKVGKSLEEVVKDGYAGRCKAANSNEERAEIVFDLTYPTKVPSWSVTIGKNGEVSFTRVEKAPRHFPPSRWNTIVHSPRASTVRPSTVSAPSW